jgi:copper chaperone CopZ
MRKFLFAAAIVMIFPSAVQAETILASVNGLVCSFCATGIEKTFKAQAAVEAVKVDLDSKLVTINTRPKQTMDDITITKLLTDSGYTVTDIKRGK